MKFLVRPPGHMLRRLILKKAYDTMEQVICKRQKQYVRHTFIAGE